MRDVKPCRRRKPHHAHRWTPDPKGEEFWCEGPVRSGHSSGTLAELLARRPELGDLTAAAITNRLAVSAA